MKTFIIFIVLNIINVILQTVKSLATTKGGKISASVMNAVAYAVYTVVLVYMTCELSTVSKALIVGGCNLVGVYIVKSLEEKKAKRKIYKIEFTVSDDTLNKMIKTENLNHYNIVTVGEMNIINFYVDKKELKDIKILTEKYDGKYIITKGENF
jgi:6-pyruvoyl-tetrahydropterin synthase